MILNLRYSGQVRSGTGTRKQMEFLCPESCPCREGKEMVEIFQGRCSTQLGTELTDWAESFKVLVLD